MSQSMSMAMIQETEEVAPACTICGEGLDEDRDEIGICRECEDVEEAKVQERERFNELAARKSQYSHLRFGD